MWLECFVLFGNSIREYSLAEIFPAGVPDEVARVFRDWAAEPVLQPPRPPIVAALVSPAAFSLGKALIPHGGPGPDSVARSLIAAMEKTVNGSACFAIANGGYINCDFPPQGCSALLRRLDAEPDFFRLFPVMIEMSAEVRLPHWKLQQDWNAVAKRIGELRDPGLARLLEGDATADVRLMQLAVLAEREIDPDIFLAGLRGKQNVPWLLRRFLADLSRYEISAGGDTAPRDLPLFETFLTECELRLCWGRYEYATAARHEKPEEFLRYLLSLVHHFYSFFNRPGFRAGLAGPLPSALAAELQLTFRLLGRATEQGVKELVG